MAVDFCKHHKGDVVRVHCCDDCARRSGVQPKSPPDSGVESWLCAVCGHFGIGSATDCTIGDWLRLQPNTLFGPGLLPNLEAAREGGGAQAWFDRESAEDEARRAKAKEAAK